MAAAQTQTLSHTPRQSYLVPSTKVCSTHYYFSSRWQSMWAQKRLLASSASISLSHRLAAVVPSTRVQWRIAQSSYERNSFTKFNETERFYKLSLVAMVTTISMELSLSLSRRRKLCCAQTHTQIRIRLRYKHHEVATAESLGYEYIIRMTFKMQ